MKHKVAGIWIFFFSLVQGIFIFCWLYFCNCKLFKESRITHNELEASWWINMWDNHIIDPSHGTMGKWKWDDLNLYCITHALLKPSFPYLNHMQSSFFSFTLPLFIDVLIINYFLIKLSLPYNKFLNTQLESTPTFKLLLFQYHYIFLIHSLLMHLTHFKYRFL